MYFSALSYIYSSGHMNIGCAVVFYFPPGLFAVLLCIFCLTCLYVFQSIYSISNYTSVFNILYMLYLNEFKSSAVTKCSTLILTKINVTR